MTVPHPAWLAPHIHFAWVGADVVVLDVCQDTFLCLVDGAEAIRPSVVGAAVSVRDAETFETLREAGLFVSIPPTPPPTVIPSARSMIIPERRPPSVAARLGAVANAVVSTAAFKRSDLNTLIARAGAWRRYPPQRTGPSIAESLDAFNAILPWMPFEEDCLQRAFMLRHHLHVCGHPATWTFGVRTWPFLAHCWVQIDDVVVGDSLERVSGFTPILAV